MHALLEKAVEWLDGENWSYDVIERSNGGHFIRAAYQGKNTKMDLVVEARIETSLFFTYAYLPFSVPEHKKAVMCELFSRINFNLNIGNFEFDMRDGEIRYKTSVDLDGSEITPKMIENMVSTTLSTADDFLPIMMAVIYGDKTPEIALLPPEESLEIPEVRVLN